MSYAARSHRDRLGAALPAALVHALLLYALVAGLRVGAPPPLPDRLQRVELLTLPPEMPQPEPPPQSQTSDDPRPAAAPREEGAASPPNLRSRATEIVAPEPVIVLPPVSPAVTSPVAGPGADPSTGNADIAGPGTGSGGFGSGSGRGGRGAGGGGGGGGGRPPRHLSGSLSNSDYPAGVGEAGIGGTVSVLYAVEVDGRVSDCRVTRSSGSRLLDETTCRLIERRFRFAPARDRQGRPVRSRIEENHSWIVEDVDGPRRRGRWSW
ncbi:MAG: energy transducer TonB [Sphingosinicella sp.]|uniref:energy transducer TonB n=1 Tax=Sphingosinicella sp. TaxID=1917971 RepID=UPI004037B5BE